ncbi:MAG: hypothetical protein C0506_06950 [Anaerolinea sp.]|nr:hypothetical protein [Anaerolinea sp.]
MQRGVVQRHLPGVLAKLAEDLTKVRAALGAYDTADPTNGNLLEYINKHVTDINALPGMVTILDSKPKLIEQLAIDMAARAEPPTAVNASHTASATDEVMNKGGGGFTAKDGTVYMLESTKDSSALYHELIHVLSGEGGVTQLSVTKTNLNEGFTNYFAEQLARKYGKTVYTAYPVATTWVNDFVAKCTENTAYNIYFKNNEALLYSTLAGRLKTKVQAAKTVFDKPESKALKESNGVKRTDLGAFYTGATIKDDAVLAAAVKKKIQEAYFMDAGEPSIAWLKRLCIDD